MVLSTIIKLFAFTVDVNELPLEYVQSDLLILFYNNEFKLWKTGLCIIM